MKRTNPDFLNGVPELLILRLVARSPMHGYDLVQAIRASTSDELTFGEGCIYPLLHKLEAAGHLTSRRQKIDGRNRVVYRTTARGQRRLAEAHSEWRRIVAAVNQAMGDIGHACPAIA
jgi:PadR family transcriptional regulator PadR